MGIYDLLVFLFMKTKHGGKRTNAGAKPRYDEPTKTVSFRVPISHVEHVKSMIKTLCELWAAK